MKKIKKVNTSKRKKKRKEAQEKLQQQASLLSKHPKECCVCHKLFERSHETVKVWQITVIKTRVRLTCPDCWCKVREMVEVRDGI